MGRSTCHWVAIAVVMALFQPITAFSHDEPLITEYRDELFSPAYGAPTELSKDEPLRKQLFDMLRVPVAELAGRKVIFLGSLKVFRNWAFYSGSVLDSKGERVGFEPMGNADCVALWLRTRAGWVLVDFSVGHSDVFWQVWHAQYGAPAELLNP